MATRPDDLVFPLEVLSGPHPTTASRILRVRWRAGGTTQGENHDLKLDGARTHLVQIVLVVLQQLDGTLPAFLYESAV
jgi:hypothetical protein